MAPEEWVNIHGFRLAAIRRIWTAADIVNGALPESLDGVSVTDGAGGGEERERNVGVDGGADAERIAWPLPVGARVRGGDEHSGGYVGPTNLAGSTGELQTTPTIRFGNRQGQVRYAGVTAAGLCPFILVVPDVANGDYPLVVSVGGVPASSASRIRVQR